VAALLAEGEEDSDADGAASGLFGTIDVIEKKPATAEEKITAVLERFTDPLGVDPVYVDKDTLRAQTGLTEGSTLDNTLTKMTRVGKIHRGPERGTYALGPGLDAE
jgi:hypothetical protein